MNSRKLKVGLIGLAEAGNLGDDLILIATINSIYTEFPDADIKFLSFGQKIDWKDISRKFNFKRIPESIESKVEIPILRQNSRVYDDRDVVIFGGGGLLQTSHSKDRPYGWLSYLPPSGRGRTRILATGLGLGPISTLWQRRLRRLGSPFDLAWFRDSDSLAFAQEKIGWTGEECRDFIDRRFLNAWQLQSKKGNDSNRRLGVALRAWPGFSVAIAKSHIESVVVRHEIDEVVFFVLESNSGRGKDVEFSENIAENLSVPSKVHAYCGNELNQFMEKMARVDLAISMKLHSSAIWAEMAIPMYPIIYAPKVASLFDRDYNGFELVDEIVEIPSPSENVPRAQQTVVEGLHELLAKPDSGGTRMKISSRTYFQVSNIIGGIERRIRLRPFSKSRKKK